MKTSTKRQTMPAKVKDPKKVAAGKARAAKAIRINGQFTTNAFLDKVKEDAEIVGATDPFQFYLQNQKEYEAVYNTRMLTTNKDFSHIKQAVKDFNGTTFKNDKEVRPATILKSLNQLNQYLKTEHDVVAFWSKIEISLNGKLNINIPSIAEITARIENGEDIDDIMEDYDFTIIVSNAKK